MMIEPEFVWQAYVFNFMYIINYHTEIIVYKLQVKNQKLNKQFWWFNETLKMTS